MTIPWPLSDGRVTVRPATLDDAPELLAVLGTGEDQQFLARVLTTPEESRAFVQQRLDDPDALICVVLADGEVVGRIGGRRCRPDSLGAEPDTWDFTLGYVVAPWARGRGIATAAVRLLVRALHEHGVRRVKAMVFADNVPSLHVLRRCGFTLEGTERAAVLGRDGRWLDDCTLAHLPGDGLAPPATGEPGQR